jgi:carbonic anhydrase
MVLSACSGGDNEAGEHAAAPQEQSGEPHEVHWGYEGEEGPDHWADLSAEYSLCASGKEQSPIDLTDPVLSEGRSWTERIGDMVLTDGQRATVMDLIDNGHTIQVTNDVPMVAIVDGSEYEMVQYHFHAPSEHTVDGRHLPLEVHFVHKSTRGELAVLGILVEEGEHDPLWDAVLSALPEVPGDERHLENLDLDKDDIRPPPTTYYRYRGSLTTPPCSENVRWIVAAEVREISPDQMATIVSLLHKNNRPVQPLNERTLQLVSGEDSED